jgi:PAS domain S-box-containing protein
MGIIAPLSHLPVKKYNRLLQIGISVIIGLILLFVFKPSTDQIAFQSDMKSIRVVMDNNYPPYTFLDENGKPQGILVDQWKLWEEKTGIKVYLTTMDWGKALAEMEAGNFDVVDTIFFNEERAKLYSFSAPYADIDVPIYFRNNISGLTDAASLKGFQVGVKAKDNAIYYLKSQGIDKFIEFESYEAIIQAARNKEILVFVVDQPPAEYFISKYGIQNEYNSSAPLYTGQFHRGVKLGDQKMLSTVENGFKLISSSEYNDIETKWYGTRINIPQYSRYIVFGAAVICLIALALLVYNRQLQRKITERTSELNTLFSAMKDMVVVTDQNGICLDRPTNATQLVPDQSPDLVGKSILELIPEPSGVFVLSLIQKVIKSQTVESSDFSVTTIGKINWFSCVVSPLDKTHILLVVRDITEWKDTQEALLESEQRFHIMFENHDVSMVLVSSQNGRLVDTNQAAADFYGFPIERLRLMNIFQFIQLPLEAVNKELRRAATEEQSKFIQIHKLANGELRTVEIHTSPVKINNEDLLFCIIFDISDRRKAEDAVLDKTLELSDAYEATLEGWSNALELRERETAGHSKRVVELTLAICRELQIPEEELIHIQRGALLHDIGKMGIPDNILLKPGPLTPDEWVVMRQHPLYAHQLLSKIPFLAPALDIPYCHHERWDGSGYPQGLRGEEIPLAARVFAIVDVWDALISNRPYRPAWTEEAAMKYLLDNSGVLFDQGIVEIFERIFNQPSAFHFYSNISEFLQK